VFSSATYKERYMQVEVRDHRVFVGGVQVPLRSTPNRGGLIKPELIVLHDTAGRLDGKSSVAWMVNKAARASANLFVDREGNVTQLAPLNVATWHAGQSKYKGRRQVNGFSIGIEIENPGKMEQGSLISNAKAWWGQNFNIRHYGIKWHKDADHGAGFWMPYTQKQLDAVTALCQQIVAAYTMRDVTTHYAISPGRKVDVNPLFPIEQVRKAALGPAAGPMGRA
jgi:N-acetylmuramoyl-L-alanine amidase